MSIEPNTFIYKSAGGCDIQADVMPPTRLLKRPPAIVFIHGGALIMGSRRRMPLGQLTRFLSAGYVVVSIDYRLAPETKLPQIIEDVRDALRWVREKGVELFRIDPERVAVVGQSAGGYLTLMAGFCVAPRPAALVSFYGYGDIAGDWYSKPDPFYRKQPAVSREAAMLSVGKTAICESDDSREPFYLYCRQNGLWPNEVAGLDPVSQRDAFKPYCPLQNVSPEYPATVLLHGDKDTDVPCEQSAMMASALSRAGVDSALVTIEGGGHSFDYDEEKPDTIRALDLVMSFLKEHV